MVVYAFFNNLVPIVMQRFNRPRMRRLLAQLEKKNLLKGETSENYGTPKTLSHSYE
jgi:hypothetical protein